MVCPYPSVEAAKLMSKMKRGQVAEVLTDSDESALKSIPEVAQRWGCSAKASKISESDWSVILEME